ncbi:hypothetical protein D3C81_1578540 [compost metagenome]
MHLPQRLFRHIHQPESLLQIAEKHTALCRKRHSPGRPEKQLSSQLGLQLLQGLADRRLGDVEPFGSFGQAPCLGRPIKYPVPFQIDLHSYYPTLYLVL